VGRPGGAPHQARRTNPRFLEPSQDRGRLTADPQLTRTRGSPERSSTVRTPGRQGPAPWRRVRTVGTGPASLGDQAAVSSSAAWFQVVDRSVIRSRYWMAVRRWRRGRKCGEIALKGRGISGLRQRSGSLSWRVRVALWLGGSSPPGCCGAWTCDVPPSAPARGVPWPSGGNGCAPSPTSRTAQAHPAQQSPSASFTIA
jgi:hypothetical protein